MWDWLTNGITSIVDGFVGIFEFLGYIIGGIGNLILVLGKLPAVLADSFHWLPPVLAGTLMTFFLIVIFFKIMGRE